MRKAFEWLGAGSGLLGSILIALNVSTSGYAFIAYLVSNVCWLTFGIRSKAWGLVSMQIGYMLTSIVGLYNWFAR